MFDIFDFVNLSPFSVLSSFIISIAASFTFTTKVVWRSKRITLQDHNQMFIPEAFPTLRCWLFAGKNFGSLRRSKKDDYYTTWKMDIFMNIFLSKFSKKSQFFFFLESVVLFLCPFLSFLNWFLISVLGESEMAFIPLARRW